MRGLSVTPQRPLTLNKTLLLLMMGCSTPGPTATPAPTAVHPESDMSHVDTLIELLTRDSATAEEARQAASALSVPATFTAVAGVDEVSHAVLTAAQIPTLSRLEEAYGPSRELPMTVSQTQRIIDVPPNPNRRYDVSLLLTMNGPTLVGITVRRDIRL
jgi:hypothetical protein